MAVHSLTCLSIAASAVSPAAAAGAIASQPTFVQTPDDDAMENLRKQVALERLDSIVVDALAKSITSTHAMASGMLQLAHALPP